MRSVYLYIIILLFACRGKEVREKEPPIIPASDETKQADQAMLAFSEFKEAVKKDGGRLWNRSLDGPILLVDRSKRKVISNVQDVDGKLIRERDYFTGSYPKDRIIANTSGNWNGTRWAVVAFPLPDTKEKRLNLLIHESFHREQPFLGFDTIPELPNIHLDSRDGRIFMKLEMLALQQALGAKRPELHVMRALLFRQYRHKLFPQAAVSENALELNEGLAEYTGSILSGRNEKALKQHYSDAIDRFLQLPTFVRSFAYFTTPVYGYFMRKIDRGWNLGMNSETDLTAFMLEFYHLSPAGREEKEILKMGEEYGIDSIIGEEIRIEEKKEETTAYYRKRFLNDSVLTLNVKKASIGFNPANLQPLGTEGMIYPNLSVTAGWGMLEVDTGGALLAKDKVIVSSPQSITDTLISGDGWKLRLISSWKLVRNGKAFTIVKQK